MLLVYFIKHINIKMRGGLSHHEPFVQASVAYHYFDAGCHGSAYIPAKRHQDGQLYKVVFSAEA